MTQTHAQTALRVGSSLLALSALAMLAAPAAIIAALPDLATRVGRHTAAGALALIALALLEFVLAVGPARCGERWAVGAAALPFVVVGLPILVIDAVHVAPARLWSTLAPQVAGLLLGFSSLILCAAGAFGRPRR